ncbi:MAG: hypothetical protein ABI333_06790 [bacterium]
MSELPLELPNDNCCPFCETELEEWEPSAYHCWENNLWFCPSDRCKYFRYGRQEIADRFQKNFGYRYCFDPGNKVAFPLIAWCGGERSYLKGRCAG